MVELEIEASEFQCRRATAWTVGGLIRHLQSDFPPEAFLVGISGHGRGVKIRLNDEGRVELF